MMQVIDKGYLQAMTALPDGLDRLERWIHQLIAERDTAEQIASAAVKGVAASRTFPPSGLQARVDALRAHLAEQIAFAETRIEDGTSMGATVWRLALEDIVSENRTALAKDLVK